MSNIGQLAAGDGDDTVSKEYEALGIFPDTWTCVTTSMSEKDAREYVWLLAASDVPVRAAFGTDGKWHIAIRGGLASNPVAWIVSLRNEPFGTKFCTEQSNMQHPQALAAKEY